MQIHTQCIFNLAKIAVACLSFQEGLEKILNRFNVIIDYKGLYKVQGSLLFVTYTIIQGIIGSEMLIRTGPLNGKCKK